MTAKFGGRGVRVSGCGAASRKQRGRWSLLLVIVAAFAVSQIGMTSSAAAQDSATAGQKKVNPKDGLTYVWIPAGKFMMGCSAGDAACPADEKPAHEVTITKGFWIGQTEVTQVVFVKVARANPTFLHVFEDSDNDNEYAVVAEGDINPSIFKGPNLPLDEITWDVGRQYCEALGMRLPTEAEWEYAARAGSDKATWGPLDQIAWHDTAPTGFLPDPPNGSTHPVAQKQPNGYGLYDMLGNVAEWTADWYGPYSAAAQVDPTGPAHGVDRVLRGGAWNTAFPTVSLRGLGYPWNRGGNAGGDRGIRCVGN